MNFPKNYISQQNFVLMNNRITELTLRNQELEISNKNLNEKYEETEKLLQKAKKDFKELQQYSERQTKQLNDKIKEQKLKIEELVRNLENTNNLYSKKIVEKDKKIQELENKYKKYNGVIKQFDKISTENEQLKGKLDKYDNVIKKNKELINENESLINNSRARLEFMDEKALKFYDVIIEIDSINKLTKSGWKINYNEERKEIYEKIVKEKTLKIGVLGVNNIGKSYILGLISKIEIPTGYSIETKGISIKYCEGEVGSDKEICLLDSAGFETPLLNDEIIDENGKINEDNKANKQNIDENLLYLQKIEQISKDKSQTERFIEELIITLSDMLILVVGKLTRREQKLIDRIKKLVSEKENAQFNSIIIIHNLSQFNELIEVDNHINNILKKSATFNLEEIKVAGIKKYEGRHFFSEKDGTDHYIMARQNSVAGKYYNEMTIELIKQKYNSHKSRRRIDIPEEITKLLSRLSKDITEDEIKINNLEISEDKKLIKMKKGINRKLIDCQQTFLDERGNYNSISSKYVPKASFCAYKERRDNILLIRLEIPGKIDELKASFRYYGKKKTILIQGTKSKEDFPESKKKSYLIIKDNRNYEQINHYLELDNDIDLIREEALEKTGIYSFKFNTNNLDPNVKKENNDDEDEEDNLNDGKDEFKEIASGVYFLKFLITDTSMKNLTKKYKRINNNISVLNNSE